MPPGADIASNLDAVRRRVATAAARAGRDPEGVTLLAVSKTFDAATVRLAVEAGQRHFGENRVQEGAEKVAALTGVNLEWHLIGHLQSNKARKAAGTFQWIHSIDRLDLLAKIDAAALELGTRPQVLIQVDLAHEDTKFGADEARLRELAQAALQARAVRLCGLMIIPPIPENPETSRPWFHKLRLLRDELVASGVPAAALRELSMGMSQDFEVAIEEGATMVRVGTAIFGHR